MALQLDILLDTTSVASVQKALEMLPKTLDSFYDRALLEIREPHQQLAAVAFQWLAASARPLSLSELAEAIVIRPGDDPCFNPDERLTDELQILKFLPAALVRKVFRKQPDADGRWLPHNEEVAFVEFAHFSVLEYLRSNRMDSKLRSTFQVQDQAAHRLIAVSCFSYMLYVGSLEQTLAEEMSELLKNKDEPINEIDIIKKYGWDFLMNGDRKYRNTWEALCCQVDKRYVLAAYANRAWQYHMSRLELIDDEFIDELSIKFLDVAGDSWILWCCCSLNEGQIYYSFKKGAITYLAPSRSFTMRNRKCKPHPVTWVSYLGLPKLLALLLQHVPISSITEQTPVLGAPLHAASLGNNPKAVQLLISAHADVNEGGGDLGLPLIAACRNSSLEIVRLLLESGADINALSPLRRYGTALAAACNGKSEKPLDLVRLLLKSGADVNGMSPSSIYGTALAAACDGRSEDSLDIVRLLLESGADVNAVSSSNLYATALATACGGSSTKSLDIVRLLLESGADVNAVLPRSSFYRTALAAACSESSERTLDIVRLLLESGADLEVGRQDNSCGAALRIACSCGFPGLAKLLLESGAKVKDDTLALLGALRRDDIDDISLLLKYGASPGSKDDPKSPYQRAMDKYNYACSKDPHEEASDEEDPDREARCKAILDMFDRHLEK